VPPAKSSVPRLSSTFVPRPRLISALDAAAPGQVVLISAPAGYGKTLLLADWAMGRPGSTAWVTLDDNDDVDRRFWAGILAALGACSAVRPDSALHTVPLPAVPSRHPPFLTAVTESIALVAEPVTLVLDDVHVLTHPDPRHGLASLVRDRPPGLQLVLSSRFDPPLRLERLRLTGQLVVLRAPALAFSLDEASALLAASDVAIRSEQVEALLEQTEGWAAGLRLAALSLGRSDGPDSFLQDLVGSGRALSDYLVGEILSGIPDTDLDVLVATSICDQVTAPLAVTLSGCEEAGDVLADLEQATSLVVSCGAGRRWFRVHPLLRAQLRADLQRRRPDRLARLHGRAARHWATSGDPVAALRHARLAQDAGLLSRLLQVHGAVLATSGCHTAVLAALEALPSGCVSSDARLLLVAALSNLEVGHLAAASRLLEQADAVWPDDADPDLVTLRWIARGRRGWLAMSRGMKEESDVAGDAIPKATGGSVTETAVVTMLLRTNAAMAAGQVREAETLAWAATAQAHRLGSAYLEARSTAMLAILLSMRGDIAGSLALARRAGEIAPADKWRGTVGDAYASFLQGYGALLQSRPEDCRRWIAAVDSVAATAPATARTEMAKVIPLLDVLRAAARFDLREHRSGLEAMRTARLGVEDGRVLDGPRLAFVALVEHSAAAALGLRAHARAVTEWAERRVGVTGDVLLMQAWGPATIGRDDAARDRLRPVLDGSVACAAPWTLLEAQLLDCRIALRSGATSRAQHALEHGVALAGAMAVFRPLVMAPATVGALLAESLGHFGDGDELVRDILALRAARVHVPPTIPLTEREWDVLELLPTLLSLDEIAEALSVSINTVRTHVRSLHGKLGVNSRADAVAIARRDGLIPSAVSDPPPAL